MLGNISRLLPMNKQLGNDVDVSTIQLVAVGKSSRLQAMRNQQMANVQENLAFTRKSVTIAAQSVSPQLQLAQQVIDQQLAQLLAGLPAGKQQRLFKIRFGVELAEIKSLPLIQVVKLLDIRHPELQSLLKSMPQIAELNYNGK